MISRLRTLAALLRNERRPRAQLLAEQFARLRLLVGHAWQHVPAYRMLWEQHGVEPSMLKTPDDFHRWPVIDKSTMRRLGVASFMDKRLAGTSALVACRTSGSSGMPFEFWFTWRHDQWRKAQYLRPYLSTGRAVSDLVLRLTAFPSARTKWFQRLGLLREHQLDAALPSARLAEAFCQLRPDVIQGHASALRGLAHHLRRSNTEGHSARLVYSDSELLTPDTRGLLRDAFGTDPIDVFGTFETDNLAWQCERRGHHHVAIDCAAVEVLDAVGRPIDSGEGDLVVTVLENLAMPFIRYNLHDRVSWMPDDCGCDRTLPLLDVRAGRADDRMLVDGERRSAMRLLGRFDSLPVEVRQYQLRQLRAGEIEIHLVPGPDYGDHIGRRLVEIVEEECSGIRAVVIVEDRIEVTAAGKYKAFESRLPGDQ